MNSKLLYKGPFGGSTGYHGNRIDVLKSGIQKYVRRDETSKALNCAISLNMFRELEPKSKCIRTVLINRLRIITCEEFAWSNPKLFHYIDNEINLWLKSRGIDEDQCIASLSNIFNYFEKVKKVRMISFIRAVYKFGYKSAKIVDKYSDVYKNIDKPYDNLKIYNYKPGDDIQIKFLMNSFMHYFELKDDRCYYWAFKILELEGKYGNRFRRKSPEYIIWEYLVENKNFDKAITDCIKINLEWYINYKSEHWMYLINTIAIALNCSKNNFKDINFDLFNKNTANIYLDSFRNVTLKIDDYCIDKHTRKGRKRKRGGLHFANIGSYVKNENSAILNQTYKNIYMDLKKLSENPNEILIDKINISIKIENPKAITFLDNPVAQLKTGKHKCSVYVHKNYVFKGPYVQTSKKFNNNIKNLNALKYLEEKLGLKDEMKSSLDIEDIISDKNGLKYFKFKNLGRVLNYNEISETRTSKIETNIKVLPRKSFIYRVSDLDWSKINTEKAIKIKIAVLQHLYLRYILSIGDSGEHNILVREDDNKSLIAGIDLEEECTKIGGEKKIDLCFVRKGTSKKQLELYSAYISDINVFKDIEIDEITKKLQEIGISNIDLIRNKIKHFNISK
jgi:hypothetical protein